MAQFIRQDPIGGGSGYPIIGANSIAFADADAVYVNTDGFLDTVTTSSQVLGVSKTTKTMAATNQTVAKVKPLYVMGEGLQISYPSAAALVQSDIGEWVDLSSATSGAMTLGTPGAKAQFFVLGIDENADATLTDGVVMIAEPQWLGSSQA